MVASISSCIVFMVIGRRWFRLPIDPVGLGAIPSLAGLFVLGSHVTAHLVTTGYIPLIFDALVFALLSGFAIHRSGLLSSISRDTVGEQMAVHSP